MGHTPVQAGDTPGFIVNHAGRGYSTEALRIVSEGIADFATIDRIPVPALETFLSRPDIPDRLVMKVPTILETDDATVIVGFEMEMMILPKLSGVHVPRLYAVGDFARTPYLVMEEVKESLELPVPD